MRLRSSTLLTAFLATGLLIIQNASLRARRITPSGIPALISRTCTREEVMSRGDGQEFFVTYRHDSSSSLNRSDFHTQDELRHEIARVMAPRAEQVLFLAADGELSYGQVAFLINNLRTDDPRLHIVLVTRRQIKKERPDGLGFEAFCLSEPPSTS